VDGTGGRTDIAAAIKKIALERVSPVIFWARLIDLNQLTKKGPAEAGPTPRSACLSSIANSPDRRKIRLLKYAVTLNGRAVPISNV
jgi:hypothetical protein